jgi:hypothetical protein
LPEDKKYYEPTDRGYEAEIRRRLQGNHPPATDSDNSP